MAWDNRKVYRPTLLDTFTMIVVVLKAFGLIDWSWWLVFTPMLVGTVIVCLIRLFDN